MTAIKPVRLAPQNKQVQSKNPEGIRGERFVIASENLVFNWGEKQDFCFEELTDASWKQETKVKNCVFKSPSLLALNRSVGIHSKGKGDYGSKLYL